MVRDDAVSRILEGLGFRSDLQAQAVARLQEAQRHFEQGKTLPWFLIVEDNPLTLAASTNSVALPTDFLREVDFQPMRFYDATVSPAKPRKLMKKTFEAALDAYGQHEDGSPQVYVLRKDSFYFFPAANQEYTLLHSYYRADVVLDTNVENEWLTTAPELLIGEAGLRLALDLRDADSVTIFRQMRDNAWTAIFSEIIAREEAARRQAVGGGL